MEQLLDDQSSPEQNRLSTEGAKWAQNFIPWMRFVGIVFIVFGFLGFLAAFFIPDIVRWTSSRRNPLWLSTLLSLTVFVALFWMGVLLIKQSNALKLYFSSENEFDLDYAFKQKRQFCIAFSILLVSFAIFEALFYTSLS